VHVVILVVIGLVVLAGFLLVARLIGRRAGAGAWPFIWVWLVVHRQRCGRRRAGGHPLINEIGAFIPIFGVPAAAALPCAPARHGGEGRASPAVIRIACASSIVSARRDAPYRIEAFSDGVFAIVVTLLVLELKVRELEHHASVSKLAHQLVELLPSS
jgi:hypothetical protein